MHTHFFFFLVFSRTDSRSRYLFPPHEHKLNHWWALTKELFLIFPSPLASIIFCLLGFPTNYAVHTARLRKWFLKWSILFLLIPNPPGLHPSLDGHETDAIKKQQPAYLCEPFSTPSRLLGLRPSTSPDLRCDGKPGANYPATIIGYQHLTTMTPSLKNQTFEFSCPGFAALTSVK